MATKITRRAYAAMYGPTVGDRIRLADTELFIRVEEDRTVYGEEVKFGGGKVIRDGMGQSSTATSADGGDFVPVDDGWLEGGGGTDDPPLEGNPGPPPGVVPPSCPAGFVPGWWCFPP